MSQSEEQTTPYYAVDGSGAAILLGGYKTINPAFSQRIQGLDVATIDSSSAEHFGESGEVFDHLLHRNIMSVLWSMETSKAGLISQLNGLHLRGKSIKLQYRGRTLNVHIPLPETGKEGRTLERNKVLGNGPRYSMKIHFPKESTNVPAWAMTPERMKCVTRPMLVSMILSDWRFPATTEAIGYADMIRDYHEIMNTDNKTYNESEWGIARVALGQSAVNLFTLSSMIAGCVSSKEIYAIDEEMFAGCIWWSGIHAMMTDAHNRLIANAQTADKRARLENSSFYSDFKRKMSARGIVSINTKEYIDFLNIIQPLMKRFVKSSSLMTEGESTLLDSIVKDAGSRARTEYKEKVETPAAGALNANSSEALRTFLEKMVGNMTISTEEEDNEEGMTASGGK